MRQPDHAEVIAIKQAVAIESDSLNILKSTRPWSMRGLFMEINRLMHRFGQVRIGYTRSRSCSCQGSDEAINFSQILVKEISPWWRRRIICRICDGTLYKIDSKVIGEHKKSAESTPAVLSVTLSNVAYNTYHLPRMLQIYTGPKQSMIYKAMVDCDPSGPQ
ncbi:hypothetical protein V6N11_008954 [Hibiscus sabdariffa]|uniref:RNase H type-1 domain-containing protein n=1 Tax=Hibiscus sabdariffa TaxID=183260 RepID=A0ABR2PP95_9ROSI